MSTVLATYLPMLTCMDVLSIETDNFGEVDIFLDEVYWVNVHLPIDFLKKFSTLEEVVSFCGPVSKIELLGNNEQPTILYSI
jgi:hypothetical protein